MELLYVIGTTVLVFLSVIGFSGDDNDLEATIYKVEDGIVEEYTKGLNAAVVDVGKGYIVQFKDGDSYDDYTIHSCEATDYEISGSQLKIHTKDRKTACPINIYRVGYDEFKEFTIFVRHPRHTAQAIMECRGKKTVEEGTSLCQTVPPGTVKYSFNVPVKSRNTCGMRPLRKGNTWEFITGQGMCIITFMTKRKEFHRAYIQGKL